jgi:hypothetical protein
MSFRGPSGQRGSEIQIPPRIQRYPQFYPMHAPINRPVSEKVISFFTSFPIPETLGFQTRKVWMASKSSLALSHPELHAHVPWLRPRTDKR